HLLPVTASIGGARAEQAPLLAIRLRCRENQQRPMLAFDHIIRPRRDARQAKRREVVRAVPRLSTVGGIEEQRGSLVLVEEPDGHREVWIAEVHRLFQLRRGGAALFRREQRIWGFDGPRVTAIQTS